MYKFSVVISVYKNDSAQFFLLAVNSVLNQTVVPTEIVISVDGPIGVELEDTLSLICKQHSEIIVMRHQNNLGLGSSRHRAILATSNSVIAVMDADDISLSTRFQKQIPLLCDGEYDVVGGWIEEFESQPGDSRNIRIVPKEHADIVEFCKRRSPMNHVTVAFQKELYMKIGGYRGIRHVEDWDLFYRMLMLPSSFYNLPEVLVMVRCGEGMMLRRGGIARLNSEIALLFRMHSSKFIGVMDVLIGICCRVPLRVMPSLFRGIIYKFIFRS